MNIFAMDTSSLTATVAVQNDEKLLGEYSVSNKLMHSQTILPMTDELLKNLSMTIDDIDVFSVCVGPGSFTGLRIGMATVKTFSQVLSKPVVGISSLDATAYNFFGTDGYVICPIIDARRDEVYNALYLNGEKIVYDRALHIDRLLEELKGKKVIFAGDAVMVQREKILSHTSESWLIAPQNLILPKASSVAYCAYQRALEHDFDDCFTLNPVYLRKSQAERELEERSKINKN
ncbi:MAG: tRNA (adenosine(37)-N6)-threonylcarbamoyltransferase complex dimerization subunit type 1 TsaB [Clostridia bacterium]|nr:tRNA (adenosine(37)-N6)-threonylcarbamoyltransferase complex dimerization subunit type 1 TsaB [Clostridia bacterium]